MFFDDFTKIAYSITLGGVRHWKNAQGTFFCIFGMKKSLVLARRIII